MYVNIISNLIDKYSPIKNKVFKTYSKKPLFNYIYIYIYNTYKKIQTY